MPGASAIVTGLPRWPRREQYIVARVGASTVFATDGLTDAPLQGDDEAPDGFGIEVWAETDEPLAVPTSSWLAALVTAVGYQVSGGAIKAEHFARAPGFMSFEVPIADMPFDGTWPAAMVTSRGTVAMLIGVTRPDRPGSLAEPYAALRYVNVRLITPSELDAIMAEGLPAAQRIAGTRTSSRLTP